MGTSEQGGRREDRGALPPQEAHLLRVAEMPCIELYLDQVLKLVDDSLATLGVPGEPVLTGSMVNNYVKQRVVSAPVKKRYTRRCLAYLLFVCAFKRVFSITEVSQMIRMMEGAGVDEARLYDAVCEAVEAALESAFEGEPAVPAPRWDAARRELLAAAGSRELAQILEAAVGTLASKVYVERRLAQASGGAL